MSVNVTLSGGPRNGYVLAVTGPWPRSQVVLSDLAGGQSTYVVDNPDDPAGPYTATYSDPSTLESGAEFYQATQGPPGPLGPAGLQGPPGEKGDPGSGLDPAGVWSQFTTYDERAFVTDGDGSSYVSIQPLNLNHLLSDAAWWQQVVARGDVGPIGPIGPVGPQGPTASPLPHRQTTTKTTVSLASGDSETGVVTLAEGYRILSVSADRACRIRLYTTAAKRTADLLRAASADPSGDHGVVVEILLTAGLLSLDLSPTPNGYSTELGGPTPNIPYTITNTSGGTATVSVTFTWQPQETY